LCSRLHRSDLVSFQASDRGMVTFGPIVVALCRMTRRPIVLRLFGGSFGDYWMSRGRLMRAFLRRTVFAADAVLLQTQRMIGQLRGEGTAALVWFSTYIPRVSAPAVSRESTRCTRFVFLGHLWRTKGLDILLDSARSLPDGVTIDIYGPPDEFSPEQVRARGGDRVVYRGQLTREQVDARLWDYDCLVLPTFHEGEGYPGVLAEAFAHGIPVITTRWLAIPEIVNDEVGILVDPGDAAGFVAAVRALHDDAPRWLRMKAAALEHARQFDHAAWAKRFEELAVRLVNA
jgi:glycosyltransferase involved in cell wall biosynthesis